jgi:hypothetical protein
MGVESVRDSTVRGVDPDLSFQATGASECIVLHSFGVAADSHAA